MKLRKLILFLSFLLSVNMLSAQNSTSSPYSGFGIGELEMASGGRNTAMGQTGIALRSGLFLNTANPASLTTIEPQSFLFDMGLNYKYTNLENTTKSVDVSDGNLSWLQLGFPITKKLFAGISLNPKSSVGYNIFTLKSIEGTNSKYQSVYEGTGGLSEAAGMFAWKLNDKISFGAKAGYLWGNVSQTLEQDFSVSSTTYSIIQEDETQYSGAYFNLGTQISLPVSAQSGFVFGCVAGLSSKLNSETATTITKSYVSSSEEMASDVKKADKASLPVDIGFGASYSHEGKWTATFDYKRSDWKDANLNMSSQKLSTNNSYRAGFEFVPNSDPRSFRQSTKYRLGYRFDSGYLKIYDNQIHEQAVSLGVGFPIRKEKSFVNFSVEAGLRGTKASHLIQEQFVKLNCSFNLWDRWFIKRQYD
jgi:hypothetical protein